MFSSTLLGVFEANAWRQNCLLSVLISAALNGLKCDRKLLKSSGLQLQSKQFAVRVRIGEKRRLLWQRVSWKLFFLSRNFKFSVDIRNGIQTAVMCTLLIITSFYIIELDQSKHLGTALYIRYHSLLSQKPFYVMQPTENSL